MMYLYAYWHAWAQAVLQTILITDDAFRATIEKVNPGSK